MPAVSSVRPRTAQITLWLCDFRLLWLMGLGVCGMLEWLDLGKEPAAV